MKRHIETAMLAGALVCGGAAQADVTVPMALAGQQGPGASVGTVTLSESKYGLVLTPALTGLPPGVHGFHVHQNGNCDAKQIDGKVTPAGAAAGHYDPDNTKKHGAPWDDGAHRGDLPALYVQAQGGATNPVLAPRLKLSDVQGRSLMVHVGGDNHSDHPASLGGGGARIACGVIPK